MRGSPPVRDERRVNDEVGRQSVERFIDEIMEQSFPDPEYRSVHAHSKRVLMTITLLLGAVLLAMLGANSVPMSSASVDKWLSYDAASNTVTFELVAGPFTFNGYRNGEATLLVPSEAKIIMNFVNKDGTPHSAIVISGEGPIPNSASDPAIPRAYTSKVLEGMPQEATDVMRFPVPASGTYRILCGVPGHGLSGMWIWLKVDPSAKQPSFGPTKQ